MNDEGPPLPRPENSIGGGLQHERTALAWERTAIAMMVAGVALARVAAKDVHLLVGGIGVAQTAGGGLLFLWAGRHDFQLHNPAAPPSAVPQVFLARIIGVSVVGFTATAFVLALILVLGP